MGNDVTIIWGITSLFIVLGFVLPFFNLTFETEYDGGVTDEVADSGINSVNAWTILTSIISGFIWGSSFPTFLNLILIPIRIAFFFTIGRNIWIGGGG